MELRSLLAALFRRWWIVLPLAAITFGIVYYLTTTQKPVYEAKATFVATLNTASMGDRDLTSALDILSRRTEIVTTYSEIATSHLVRIQAMDEMELQADQRRGLSVKSRVVAGTNILEISVESPDPQLAAMFANKIGEKTSAFVTDLYASYELTILDPATVPGRPAKPNVTFNLTLGVVAGLILGGGVALLSVYISASPATNRSPGFAATGSATSVNGYQRQLNQLIKQNTDLQNAIGQAQALMESTKNDTRALLYLMRSISPDDEITKELVVEKKPVSLLKESGNSRDKDKI